MRAMVEVALVVAKLLLESEEKWQSWCVILWQLLPGSCRPLTGERCSSGVAEMKGCSH